MSKLRLLHKKSNVQGKVPTQDQLEYGELAINYYNENPQIFIKDSSNNVVSFDRLISGKTIKTINGQSIVGNGNIDIASDVDIIDLTMELCSYDYLVDAVKNSTLIPNKYYRITDYVTTTKQSGTKSANHQFDIIVQAISENDLSEDAIAIHNSEDSYFSNSKLNSWVIKYCLSNDDSRFAWADTENGKGVIYYMKDEFNNEAWYDFKNILFTRNAQWVSDNLWFTPFENMSNGGDFYTFSRIDNGDIVDDSLGSGEYPTSDNKLGHSTTQIPSLNNTIFIGNGSFANYLADGHSNNTFGSSCWNNVIGPSFKNNIINSYFQHNSIGSDVKDNIFKDSFNNNIINSKFQKNTLCFVTNSSFGNEFYGNEFEDRDMSINSKVMCCTFGRNIKQVKTIPSSMMKVKFEDNIINSNIDTYINNIVTHDGDNLYSQLKSEERDEEVILYKNENKYYLSKKSDVNLVNNKINRLNNNVYYLGNFDTSGAAESAVQNANISRNKEIVFIYYTVGDKNGIIRQQVNELETYQYINWGGDEKKRKLTFQNIGGNMSLIQVSNWETYYDKTNNLITTLSGTVNTISNDLSSFTTTFNNNVKEINDIITENESVTSRSLNDLNNRIDNLTNKLNELIQKVEDNAKITAYGLNFLNDKYNNS